MPLLEHHYAHKKKLILAQSLAIASYCSELALGAKDFTSQERATDQMFLNTHCDIQEAMYKCLFGTEEGKAKGVKDLPKIAKKYLTQLETMVPESGFVLGKETPTCADIALYDNITSSYPGLIALKIDVTPYKKINAIVKLVGEVEGIKAYKAKK